MPSPTEGASPFAPAAEGLRVAVRAEPGAGRSAVDGPIELAGGGLALKVRLAAPAEGGKANSELVRLLAKAWRLPRRDLELVAGRRGRSKTLLVRGETAALARRLEAWLAAAGRRG